MSVWRPSWRAVVPRVRHATLLVGLAVAVSAFTPHAQLHAPPAGPAFQTVHMFNLADGEVEQLAGIMRQYNALFVRLGHPENRYRLWRLEGDAAGRAAYLWESQWPSRAVYDEVHATAEYQELLRSTFPSLSQLLRDHQYGQYGEVAVGDEQP